LFPKQRVGNGYDFHFFGGFLPCGLASWFKSRTLLYDFTSELFKIANLVVRFWERDFPGKETAYFHQAVQPLSAQGNRFDSEILRSAFSIPAG